MKEIIIINGAMGGVAKTVTSGYHKNYAASLLNFGTSGTFIMEKEIKQGEVIGSMQSNAYHGNIEGISPTITAACGMGGGQTPMIVEQEPKILSYSRNSKGKVISRHTKDVANTLHSSNFENTQQYVVEPQVLRMERTEEEKQRRHNEGDKGAKFSAAKEMKPRKDGVSNTLTSATKDNLVVVQQQKVLEQAQSICSKLRGGSSATMTKDGTIRGINAHDQKAGSIGEMQIQYEANTANTVTTTLAPKCYGETTGWRIRKLTTRECFRLMNVDDEDIDKIQAAGIPKTKQYCLAGNSIVTNVLYEIFRKMFIETQNENKQLELF